MGSLHSRSRSQQWLKMSVNVCPDDIFWSREHFVTKLAVVMQHHKPECCEKIGYCNQSQGYSRGQNVSICPDDIFWTNKHLVTKLGIVMDHREPECRAKRLLCYFSGQGHSKGSYDHYSFYCIFWTAGPFVIKLGLIVHYRTPVCPMVYLDCCLHSLRLFTPGSGSRKQNIFSSHYTHSWWIIRLGYAVFNVRDPIPMRSWF